MSKLRQVALVLVSVILGGGVALGQAKLGLYVVDSAGQKVGYATSQTEAVIPMNGSLYRMAISRDGFWALDFAFAYSEEKCAGTEYMIVGSATDPRPMFPDARFTTDGVVHYSAVAGVQMIARQSGRNILRDGTLTPCFVDSQSVLAAPHLTIAAPTFTPPFLVVDAFPVTPPPAQATFDDVPTNNPYFQFIEALRASGITSGCQANPPLYCPDRQITRAEMAVFLSVALGL